MAKDDDTERWIANEVIGGSGVSTIVDSDTGTAHDVGDDLVGGILTRLANGTMTVNDGAFSDAATGVTDPTINPLGVARVTDSSDVASDFAINIDDGGAFSPNVVVFARWDESAGEWDVRIDNSSGFNATFEWQLLEVEQP